MEYDSTMNEETTPETELQLDEPAPQSVEVVETIADEPAPAPAPAKPKAKPGQPANHYVVGGTTNDTVHLSACVYKNPYARKSLSVHHLQRRLVELGFDVAGADKDGWYGDLTAQAVGQWQKANKKPVTERLTLDELLDIFKDDPYIEVAP